MVRTLARLPLLVAVLIPASIAGPSLSRYEIVEVPALRTSAYVASVSMTVTPFRREHGAYRAEYSAAVFPYFFLNEAGRLEIEVPDEALRQVEKGAAISFQGKAIRSDGKERPVDGRVSATGPDAGRIKVRVVYSRKITLVFNTTYRLAGPPDSRPR